MVKDYGDQSKSLLTIETTKGDVDLPMLVGALLRSTEVKTIGERRLTKAKPEAWAWRLNQDI